MVDISRALMGLGAAFKNEVPQFRQQMMQEDELNRRRMLQDEQLAEKRKATMFMDAAAANQFLQSGDLDSVAGIFEDRMNILGQIPNVDTRHTQEKLGLVRAARSGDTQALSQLKSLLGNEVAVGQAYGLIPKAPERKGITVGNNIVDPVSGKVIYEGKPDEDKIFDRESGLRKEFNALPQVKEFAIRSSGLGTVLASAADPSPAGDISLIFAYMKMLDPNSVVREGEFATAQSAGSIPETIWAKYNQALEGTRLADTVRKDFVDRAQRIYDSASEKFGEVYSRYEDISRRSNLDPSRSLIDYRFSPEAQQIPLSAVQMGVTPDDWALMTPEEQALYN